MKLGRRVNTIGGGQSCTVELYKSNNSFTALKILRSKKIAKNEYCNVKYLQDECSEKNQRYKSKQFIMEVRSIKSGFSVSKLTKITELAIPYYPVTLSEFLKTCPDIEVRELLFKQILLGVCFIHNNHIYHRDLKIDNICISQDGIIKIIDFGSSIHILDYNSHTELDCVGIHGTDPYISPDASENLKYNGQKNDLWALGIILYVLVNSEAGHHQSTVMHQGNSFYLSPESSSSSVHYRGSNSKNAMILYPWLNFKDTKYLAYKLFQEEFEKRLVEKNLTYLSFLNDKENSKVFDDVLIEEFMRIVLHTENLKEASLIKFGFLKQVYKDNNKVMSLKFQQGYFKTETEIGFFNLVKVIPMKFRLLLSSLLAINPKLRCESAEGSFLEKFLEKSCLKDVGEFPDLSRSKNFSNVIHPVNQIIEKKLRKLNSKKT